MLPISRRFATLVLLATTMTGCSTIISSLAESNNPNAYGPLVNQAIPGNALHVYLLPRPTSNIGRTTSMSIRADKARVERVSNAFALAGAFMTLIPSMDARSSGPLFLICTASLTGSQTADWWTRTSLEPSSLMAGVADKKYCFTENGRIHGH